MKNDSQEQADTTYRPWSWITGFAFAAFVFWLMFELSLRIGA